MRPTRRCSATRCPRRNSTACGSLGANRDEFFNTVAEKVPVRLLKVVNIQTGAIIFESGVSQEEFSTSMQTAFFRKESGLKPVDNTPPAGVAAAALKGKILSLINEQNVSGPFVPWHQKVFGKAVAVRSTATPVEKMYPVQATLSLRLVRVKDGEILSAANVVGAGMHAEFVSAGTKALQAVAGEKNVKFIGLDAQVLKLEVTGMASFEIGGVFEKLGKKAQVKIGKISSDSIEGELK